MRTLVTSREMKDAGRIIVEQLGEFIDCDELELQILLDGPENPFYLETLIDLNPFTHDNRILVIEDDRVQITETDTEFDKMKLSFFE